MDPVKLGSSQSGAFSADDTLQGTEPSAPALSPSGAQQCLRGALSEALPAASEQLAVRSLLEAYSRPTPPLSALAAGATETGAVSAATPRTDNNAARTSSRGAADVYAQAGYTSSGDGVFAGVAALKQHDSTSGADVEVFTASAQLGAQSELQAGVARIGGSHQGDNLDVSVGAEFLSARVNAGIHNDDDSHGANLGAMATGAGVELSASYSGWSVTAGLSLSLGAAVSSGERNIDGDETPERCFKMSLGPATAGFCTEL